MSQNSDTDTWKLIHVYIDINVNFTEKHKTCTAEKPQQIKGFIFDWKMT